MTSKVYLMIAALVVMATLVVVSYDLGKRYQQSNIPTSPTNVVITEAKPCPDLPERMYVDLPECIYNDRFAYKVIKFVHKKDGRVCYGLRSYDRGRFEAMWCEK